MCVFRSNVHPLNFKETLDNLESSNEGVLVPPLKAVTRPGRHALG